MIAFAIFNLHLTGVVIVAIGLSCNLLVLLVNDGVPVRIDAIVDVGVDEAAVSSAELGPGRRLEEPGDRLEPLTAIIPVPALSMVLTFGDLVALFGLANVAFRLARRSAASPCEGPQGGRGRTQPRNVAPPPPRTRGPSVSRPPTASSTTGCSTSARRCWTAARSRHSASLAPDGDDEPAPELVERYSGQPLPSRR